MGRAIFYPRANNLKVILTRNRGRGQGGRKKGEMLRYYRKLYLYQRDIPAFHVLKIRQESPDSENDSGDGSGCFKSFMVFGGNCGLGGLKGFTLDKSDDYGQAKPRKILIEF
jgi:hypothetical protein